MSTYRVIPIDRALALAVRTTLRAPGYGHPAHVEMATGYGPCRVCLQPFAEGEERRVLFTHDPFAGRESFPLPGPVFIHERDCTPHPTDAPFPDSLRFIPLTLNAYGRGRLLVAQRRIEGASLDEAVDALFAEPLIDYIHLRNTEAGCYIAHLDRAETGLMAVAG